MDDDLRGIRGAVYIPQDDWNAYQTWANYRNSVVERDLGYATKIGLNSLRVFASYEFWREDGPEFFAHVEHFLTTCESRGIRPLVVLFEAPPEAPPTEQNLHATDPENAFGVHSPSRPEVLQPRNWTGYDRSPIHFARRWAQEYATDDRLLATEIMNEPGTVQPRRDFVTDALRTVREAAPDATLTMGTRDVRFAELYDREVLDDLAGLDAYQFHMNLPRNPESARQYVADQRALADEIAGKDHGEAEHRKPLWCTEWQRTLEEPPSRFAPNLASLAPTIREAHDAELIDGDFFWSLMLRPAYLREPREKGRINGLFHSDGAVYSRLDAEVIAGRPLELTGRHELPTSWRGHRFPYPEPVADGVTDPADAAYSDGSARSDDEPRSDAKTRSDALTRAEGSDDRDGAETTKSNSDGTESFRDLRESLAERIRRTFGLKSDDEWWRDE
ncbi:glycoside hydrolase 5 family protein [Halorussus salinisoli]|uniref:hypothetical protein n=1 Tax=Halorussus salinisoli TaxID=2558242 RepID=UPI0010C1B8C1|nr:hypothetical protein [Halorussus salinisoli]